MWIIINCDDETGELIEVIGPFDKEAQAEVYAAEHKLGNFLVRELTSPN
jgi:hypothetical protein